MDMAETPPMAKLTQNKFVPLLLAFICAQVKAAEVEVKPSVSVGVQQTDNATLVETDKKSSTISIISPSVNANIIGNDGVLKFAYSGTQAIYSHDQAENKWLNQMDLSVYKALNRTKSWWVDGSAEIKNVPRSDSVNQNNDLLLGEVVETRSAAANLGYSNQKRGEVAVSFMAGATGTNSKDDADDHVGYHTNFSLGQGKLVKEYFWDLSYSFDNRSDQDRSNSSQTANFQIGAGDFYNLSPVMTAYAEKYKQDITIPKNNVEQSLSKAGAGLRYKLSKRSYLQVAYDYVISGPQENSIAFIAHWEPSERTVFNINYGVQYFGKSLEVKLKHRNKRLTNSINYSEAPESFERYSHVDNENAKNLNLTTRLEWSSELALKRGSIGLMFSQIKRGTAIDSLDDAEVNHRAGLNYKHSLSPSIKLTSSVSYNMLENNNSDDQYLYFNALITHQLQKKLSVEYGVKVTDAKIDSTPNNYQENRIYLNLKKQF